MADDRDSVRAALARGTALVQLATEVGDAARAQLDALHAAVAACALPLKDGSRTERPSRLAGLTALVLAGTSGPSRLLVTVAEQQVSAPALHAQTARARQVRSLMQPAVEAARPADAGRLRGLFRSQASRQEADSAYARLLELLSSAERNRVAEELSAALTTARDTRPAAQDDGAAARAAAEVLGLEVSSILPLTIKPEQLDSIRDFLRLAPAVLQHRRPLVTEVERAFVTVQDRMVAAKLAEMPVGTLKQATDGRVTVRVKALTDAGCYTVQDVLVRGSTALSGVHGISDTTARQLVAAARQLSQAVREDLRFRIDLDRSDPAVTQLLVGLHRLRDHDRVLEGRSQDVEDSLDLLHPLGGLPDAARHTTLLGRTDPAEVMADVRALVTQLEGGLLAVLRHIAPTADAPSTQQVWDDFEDDSAGYYTTLAQVVDLDLDDDAAAGHLPTEIVEAVHAQPLDESVLEGRVSLRGYQSFGARYAIVQRRTLLGDEMGLGKTVQAIAVMAHLSAGGAQHHLVVCPASVLVNWTKEVRRHSALSAYLVHGSDRNRTWQTWQRRGGVAVTTFGTLPVLPPPPDSLPLVVVDEAHYLKNPRTQRAKALLPILTAADRALLLTGTPLENRLEEFSQIVSYLQPDVAARLTGVDGLTSPRRFREELAPVYLRRNQQDVLQELPDLVVTPEWGEYAPQQLPGYRAAVASGNFMRMRRVAVTDHPDHSAKLLRLREIADEAAANGHKVIVFSYFRDVLAEIARVLGDRVVGPLTGSVPATARQALVDEFARRGDDAVLLSQITAGGTGMNMQAGSVVIICEPQVKPSLETQAIARAHRMGQLRGVQVHRLLTADSVDQRMIEILEDKQRLFDEYARGSEVAAASPEAVDVSEKKLAAQVIELEMERLAVTRAEQLAAEAAEDEQAS